MRRTPWPRLVLVAVATAAASAALLRIAESRGGTLLPVPALAWVVVLVIAGVVGVLGWNVRQYTRGKRPGLDMILAARTVVLAKAAGYTGALLTGWYAAHVLVTIGDLDTRRDVAVSAAVAALAAVVLAVVGQVAERWCEVPPPDDDDKGGGAAAASGSTA